MSQIIFNPFTGNFDFIDKDIRIDSTEPVGKPDGYISLVEADLKVYLFSGGNRYCIDVALCQPTGGNLVQHLFAVIPTS